MASELGMGYSNGVPDHITITTLHVGVLAIYFVQAEEIPHSFYLWIGFVAK